MRQFGQTNTDALTGLLSEDAVTTLQLGQALPESHQVLRRRLQTASQPVDLLAVLVELLSELPLQMAMLSAQPGQ